MSREKVKVIVEIMDSCVRAVYAGTEANTLIEAIVVDHDTAAISEDFRVEPLADFDVEAVASYDGLVPAGYAPAITQVDLATDERRV